MASHRFASLFSGCGGFDLGFQDSGMQCVAAWDIDPLAVEVHRENLGSTAECRDVTDADLPVRSLRGIDVLIAGPPCQGFSTLGKRQLSDQRNHLLVLAGTLAVQTRARVIVIENVSGVLAGDLSRYWKKLKGILENAGYSLAQIVCQQAQSGVAQTRKRVLLIASREHSLRHFQLPTKPKTDLRNALKGLEDVPNHSPQYLDKQSRLGKIASYIGTGQKLCNVRGGSTCVHTWQIPEVFGKTNAEERRLLHGLLRRRRQNRLRSFGDADPVSCRALSIFLRKAVASDLKSLLKRGYVRKVGDAYDLVHTFNGKLKRLRWDSPAPTVDTRFGDPWYFLHPDEDRGFTVREAARIQGFPDSFIFSGELRAQYRLIGNAVPPPLSASLATVISQTLL